MDGSKILTMTKSTINIITLSFVFPFPLFSIVHFQVKSRLVYWGSVGGPEQLSPASSS